MRPLRLLSTVFVLGCEAADPTGSGPSSPPDAFALPDAIDPPEPVDAQDAATAEPSDSGETPRLERVSIVDHDLWRRVELADDPFQDGGAVANCDRPSYFPTVFVGEFAFEIETGGCNYMTFVQPSRQTIRVGELVKARLWHFELIANGAAEAHIALRIGELAWEITHPIPTGSGLDAPKWRAEREVPEGTPIYFHVDNHGANDWVLIELSTGP